MFSKLPTNEVLKLLRTALNRRERVVINHAVEVLVSRRAPLGRQWQTLAMVMEHNGEINLALAAQREFTLVMGNAPARQLEEVNLLQRLGRPREARSLLRSVQSRTVDGATYAYIAGSLDVTLGDFEEGQEKLAQAVALAPYDGRFWLALAMAGNSTDNHVITRLLEQRPKATERNMQYADQYYYALGTVFADKAEYDDAFEAFSTGAAIASKDRKFDRHADARIAAMSREGFTAGAIADISRQVQTTTTRPIIVTGHPRSGTTLVEQILTGHSEVSDGAELGLMRVIGQEIGGHSLNCLNIFRSQGGKVTDLSNIYLHLLNERFGKSGRVIDKTLTASRTLGLLAALLPEAPIVWLRRDTLDCAWSCYRTFFQNGHDWSFDQQNMAMHFKHEDEQLLYWQSVLGSRLLIVDYEKLVQYSVETIRSILLHCHLSEESSVYDIEARKRYVNTASVRQVRSAISARSIGAALPYRRHLQPFVDAYGYRFGALAQT